MRIIGDLTARNKAGTAALTSDTPTDGPPPVVSIRLPPAGDIARAILIVLSFVALGILVWQLSSVVLLAFAAVLVAVGLRSFASLITRVMPFSTPVAVGVAVVLVTVVFTGFGIFLGNELVTQARFILTDLPGVLDSLGQRFGIENLGPSAMAQIESWFQRDGVVENLLGVTAGIISAGANLLVALTVGIYFAFRPESYEGGLLSLVPTGARERLREAFEAAGNALHHWLGGQLISMLLVGILTSVALLLLGVPSWLALGVLAGFFEFIPYVGPFLAAAPAILIALGEGGSTVFWVAGAFILVQQLEGSVITPLLQQRVAQLPPVVAILALTAMGIAFGPLGVLLAIPAAIVALVLVRKLYLREPA